jgi:hypothetical protein
VNLTCCITHYSQPKSLLVLGDLQHWVAADLVQLSQRLPSTTTRTHDRCRATHNDRHGTGYTRGHTGTRRHTNAQASTRTHPRPRPSTRHQRPVQTHTRARTHNTHTHARTCTRTETSRNTHLRNGVSQLVKLRDRRLEGPDAAV